MAFVPYTITEQQHHALLNFLGEVPAKWSNPIASTLVALAEKAANAANGQSKPVPDAPKE